MRAIIAGFFTATLYTLIVGLLMATSMPNRKQLEASIETSYLAAASAELTRTIEAESSRTATLQ